MSKKTKTGTGVFRALDKLQKAVEQQPVNRQPSYLTAERVGYVSLRAVEDIHGKVMRDLLAFVAKSVGNGVIGENLCNFESLADHIETIADNKELTSEKGSKFLLSFLEKCRAKNCTGDLLFIN